MSSERVPGISIEIADLIEDSALDASDLPPVQGLAAYLLDRSTH